MKHGDRIPFHAARETIGSLDSGAVARLAGGVGDLSFVIDADGCIVDASFTHGDPVGRKRWIGVDWIDTVTSESRAKITEMLAAAAAREEPRWRQITHSTGTTTPDVAVRYLTIATTQGNFLAVGQDLATSSALQARLIQTQQSLERDYLKLRQAEARYRLLFDLDSEPVLIVDADTRRIRDANPAATMLAKAKPGALANRALTSLIDAQDHETLLGYLGAITVSDNAEPVEVALPGKRTRVVASATMFRQDRTTFMLVRLLPAIASDAVVPPQPMALLIEQLPDAIVLTDAKLMIVAANPAFLDLTQAVSVARLRGLSLGNFVGRQGIDLDLIGDQLRQHGTVRNLTTIVRSGDGSIEEVEVSAVALADLPGDGFGFSLRSIERRARDVSATGPDLPRSVEQLTELVGRMPLKDIVRESTDLIERLCIEAALQYTADNRASAAEILGVSRQSLYSKLHRHGLGNLVGEE